MPIPAGFTRFRKFSNARFDELDLVCPHNHPTGPSRKTSPNFVEQRECSSAISVARVDHDARLKLLATIDTLRPPL